MKNAPNFKYHNIITKADRFLFEFWPDGSIPVPISDIIEFDLGLDIVPIRDLKRNYDIDGVLSKDMRTIWIDQYIMDNVENRSRFTLAHEVGHMILHREIYKDLTFSDHIQWIKLISETRISQYTWFERQADDFAGLVLVPPDQLLNVYAAKIERIIQAENSLLSADPYTINRYIAASVAKHFHVSKDVAEIRIRKDRLFPDKFIR